MKNDALEREIEKARRSISSDGYPMSIGELTNLYRDGELVIRPEFQRLFRWTSMQKSRLIESLLLGIPLPSIFVAQTEDGKWELVDGLQRVSTILELQGELLGENGEKRPQLTLEGTVYLPALEGRVWQGKAPKDCLSEALRLDIKRAKLDIKIIKRGSSAATKFDLFQRLNSYGSPLTAQETRSALIVAISPDCFSWLGKLADYEAFRSTTSLNERLIEERFDLELVLRFLVLHNRPESQLTLTALRDFTQVLDNESVRMASDFPAGSKQMEAAFRKTFDFVAQHGGENVFRKWDGDTREFRGSFLGTAYEVFALGLGYNFANRIPVNEDLIRLVKQFWRRPEMAGGFSTGKSTEKRLTEFVPLGRRLVADDAL